MGEIERALDAVDPYIKASLRYLSDEQKDRAFEAGTACASLRGALFCAARIPLDGTALPFPKRNRKGKK
jgi:hypothetical protein